MRPALYGAWHAHRSRSRRAPGAPIRADIVGPVCETTDTLGGDRELPPVEVGDLLAIRDTGAYGAVMASNYNRRPMAAEVMVDDGRRDGRAAAPDDRRHAAVGRVMLIAFEGLDQSGKETQARHLRARLEQDGRTVALAVVSRLRHADRPGDRQGARTASATSTPDVMQLLYVANRFEYKPRLDRWLGAGDVVICDRYRASSVAYGEAQGLDPAWLDDIQRSLPQPAITVLLDIAPETAVTRKAAGRDRYERDLALLARVRESYRRQARRHGWVVIDGEQSKDDVTAAVTAGGPATARATVSARTLLTPASSSTRPHASSVAPVVITSSTSTTTRLRQHVATGVDDARTNRRERVGVAHVGVAPGGRQAGLRRAVPAPAQDAPHRQAEVTREIVRLVEAAAERAPGMQRHGHERVGAGQHVRSPASRIRRASGSASTRRRSYLKAWTIRRSEPSYRPALRAIENSGSWRRHRGHLGSVGCHEGSASPQRTQHGGVSRGSPSSTPRRRGRRAASRDRVRRLRRPAPGTGAPRRSLSADHRSNRRPDSARLLPGGRTCAHAPFRLRRGCGDQIFKSCSRARQAGMSTRFASPQSRSRP